MSTGVTRIQTSNQLVTDYDTQKIFRFNTEIVTKGNYTNPTGVEVTLPIGTVFGRISATGLLLPLATDAVDGSEFPVGILAEGFIVAIAGTLTDVPLVDIGDVVESLIVLPAGDTLEDIISGKRLKDRIMSDTRGINLITSIQNSKFDN